MAPDQWGKVGDIVGADIHSSNLTWPNAEERVQPKSDGGLLIAPAICSIARSGEVTAVLDCLDPSSSRNISLPLR